MGNSVDLNIENSQGRSFNKSVIAPNTFDSLANMYAHVQIITNDCVSVWGCVSFEAWNLIVLNHPNPNDGHQGGINAVS